MFKINLIIIVLLQDITYADYSGIGPYSVEATTSMVTPSGNISTQCTLFEPLNGPNTAHVILTHGFLRDQGIMSGLAQHYASWGLKVVTMNLLNSSIINNNPLQDAEDLNWISDEIGGGGPVIYVGHSAGGMRSVVAAAQDSESVAVLGLDLVDASDNGWGDIYLALENASSISIPIWGLMAELSSCNADGNGLDVYNAAEGGNAIRITESDHCDYESPTDFLCNLLCDGTNDLFSDAQIDSVILNLSTSFLLWQAGIDSDIQLLWTPGNEYYNDLITAGAITQLVELSTDKELTSPKVFKIFQNYPNPFNPVTTIAYDIPNDGFVNIIVYDVIGNVVKKLNTDKSHAGLNKIEWNGTNNQGQLVSAGMYLYSVEVGSHRETKKMIFLK